MIYSLGKIVTDDRINAFHNDKHIYPVGYKSGRVYGSVQDPNEKVEYICEILDGGKGPIFRVTPAIKGYPPFESGTPSGVWKDVFYYFITRF